MRQRIVHRLWIAKNRAFACWNTSDLTGYLLALKWARVYQQALDVLA